MAGIMKPKITKLEMQGSILVDMMKVKIKLKG